MELIAKAKSRIKKNKYTEKLMVDMRFRTVTSALCSLGINIAYAVYNCYLGIVTASAWFVTMCFYYALIGFMRFFTIINERKNKGLDKAARQSREYRVMRHIGILLLFLTFALSGTVVLTIKNNHIIAHGIITMITIAAYTFYKITLAIINFVKVRRHNSPLLSTIRNINIADAAMSVLPMQTSMIASFDNGGMDLQLMTILTGSGICVVIMYLSITMLRKSRRNKKWQNQN